jgi:nicotinamidase-related amidase
MPESFFELPLNRVAVVLIDFQNDFCSPEVAGDGPATNTNNAAAALRANAFARDAASLGARVVYTQQVLDLERLTERQRRWERADGLCAAGSWGVELFIPPVPGSEVIVKDRFDSWQSAAFEEFLTTADIDGLVICGVELVCCVLYAILGASERGYHYVVPPDLVSGQDFGDETDNRAVRDFLRFNQPDRLVPSAEILARWRVRRRSSSSRG